VACDAGPTSTVGRPRMQGAVDRVQECRVRWTASKNAGCGGPLASAGRVDPTTPPCVRARIVRSPGRAEGSACSRLLGMGRRRMVWPRKSYGASISINSRTWLVCTSALTVLTVAACGDSGSQASSPATRSAEVVSPSAPTTSPTEAISSSPSSAAESSGPQVLVDFTDPAGWHYAGSFPLPSGRGVSFSKDVSSSPPGKAKATASLGEPYPFRGVLDRVG